MDDKREYVLTGTITDLADIMEKEFDFSTESSRLAALVLLKYNEELGNNDLENTKDYDAWYFHDKTSFTTPIPLLKNGVMSVSLQKAAIDLLRCLCGTSIECIALNSTPDIMLVRDVILLLWNNIKVVPPDLRCVYFSALKWKKENKKQHFTPQDLVPDFVENVCIYLEQTIEPGMEQNSSDWVCKNRNKEECRLAHAGNEKTIEEIKKQLVILRDNDILKEYAKGMYDFKL